MKPETRRPLWAVVQGETAAERAEAGKAARAAGAARVIVAATKLDQSYEPRIVRVKK